MKPRNSYGGKNSAAIVRIVVNQFEKPTVLGRLIHESLKQVSAPPLPIMIGDRQCWELVNNARELSFVESTRFTPSSVAQPLSTPLQ